MGQDIYLDNSTTTRPSPKAVSEMMPYFSKKWGVPSAPHEKGQELFPAIEESLKNIYTFLGAKESDHFVFTSSGAEAINQVIQSVYHEDTLNHGKNHFITSQIDEAPAIMGIHRLEKWYGCVGTMVKSTAKGIIDRNALAEMITPRTALISLSWANGLTGVINPVEEIAELCHLRGIKLHLDASHVLGKLFYDLEHLKPDFITFNGDHFHAPKGTGGLWIKTGNTCAPLIVGGNEQAGQRAGPLDVSGLVALGYAAKEAQEARDFLCTETARLRDLFEQEVLAKIPEAVIFYREQERLPHCTAMAFPGVPNELLLFFLNREGVYGCIGGGSMQQMSYLLTASDIDPALANTAINFSLSRETTEEEILGAVKSLVEAVQKIQTFSTHMRKNS